MREVEHEQVVVLDDYMQDVDVGVLAHLIPTKVKLPQSRTVLQITGQLFLVHRIERSVDQSKCAKLSMLVE